MSDLVAETCNCGCHATGNLCMECCAGTSAGEIERLTAELCGANAAHGLRATRQADEIGRLRAALKWALDYIADGSAQTPRHDCEYQSNPEKGACDFHECYWRAREALAGTSDSQKATDISDGEA